MARHLTSPAEGATFIAPATITVTANASDSDGTIAQVDFYAGTTLIGVTTAAPHSITWNNVAAGSYTLTAAATDNLGATTVSAAVQITVNAPPPLAPAAPTSLTAAAISQTQINLAWADNSGNEDGFQIERGISANVFTQIAVVGANVTSFADTGLASNKKFYYRVRAYNGAGASAPSNTASAKTPR